MSNQLKKRWTLILLLAWMILIFLLSHQTGHASASTSSRLVSLLQNIFHLDHYVSIDTLHFLVRKTAHMSLYFILTLLTYLHLSYLSLTHRQRSLLTLIIPILYACSDEIHQLFVVARAGSLLDVGIDSLGVCMAILCIFLWNKIIHKINI